MKPHPNSIKDLYRSSKFAEEVESSQSWTIGSGDNYVTCNLSHVPTNVKEYILDYLSFMMFSPSSNYKNKTTKYIGKMKIIKN